jgi:hypothetical protein
MFFLVHLPAQFLENLPLDFLSGLSPRFSNREYFTPLKFIKTAGKGQARYD